MTKPFDNKKKYDSGRLRHKISFLVDVVTDDGYGGSVVSSSLVLETWAGKEEVSQYTQAGLNAGQTEYNYFQYFVIRSRKSFVPRKDMLMVYDNHSYVIRSVIELDDPCTFLKLLCVASEQQVDLQGVIYAGGSEDAPVTEADIKALPNKFTPNSTEFTFNTGLNRIFSVAIKADKVLQKVYDTTSDENVTWLYEANGNVLIDGLNYTIYTMQNTLAFSSNHIHKVTIG